MKKNIKFEHKSGPVLFAQTKKLESKDLKAPTPALFDTAYDGRAILSLSDFIGMVFPNGDVNEKPMLYIRHTDMLKKQFRFGNLLELGDTWLDVQKGAYHTQEVGQGGSEISEYHAIDEETYGYEGLDPHSEFIFSKDRFKVKEGSFMELDYETWPYAIVEHESMYNNVSTIIQAASIMGLYENRPCLGLGEHDRLFIPSEVHGFDGITNAFGYFYMNMMGIREEDGRREQALISIDPYHGKNFCYYYIDGETPIFTDKAEMETEWTKLPYVDDGTCIYKDAIFRFGGKEFHFEGKWGSKGFTIKPRVEKHGQSQIFGTWYEGKTPYRHRLFMTFGENMEAYDYKLKELGFDVNE